MKTPFSWIKDKRGATAIEYGIIVAGIAVVIAALIFTMGDDLVTILQAIADRLVEAAARAV